MKKIFGLLLSIALISNLMMGIAFASEKITSEDLRQISASEIPDGVIPMEFKTESDALAYLNEVFSISNTVKEPANALLRSTNGNATVDSERIGVLGGTVTLKLRYGTSGNGNTGTITYTDPYTVTSGFNMGFTWTENSLGAEIMRDGKDVFCYADGVISAYINLESGATELYEREVNLEGTVAVIR